MRISRHSERSEAIQRIIKFWISASRFALIAMMTTTIFSISACGNKGKLKTPTQIEKEEAKKVAKEKKKTSSSTEKVPSDSPHPNLLPEGEGISATRPPQEEGK